MERIRGREFVMLIDESSVPGVIFIGRAKVATEVKVSRKIWQIQKVDESIDPVQITFAEGDISFNKRWDERLTISYTTIV